MDASVKVAFLFRQKRCPGRLCPAIFEQSLGRFAEEDEHEFAASSRESGPSEDIIELGKENLILEKLAADKTHLKSILSSASGVEDVKTLHADHINMPCSRPRPADTVLMDTCQYNKLSCHHV